MMKVLWFSNSPAAAYDSAIKGTGAWMAALDKSIQDKVELHVAYHYPYKQDSFINGRTCYHPIYTGNIIMESIKRRFSAGKQKDYTEEYLQIVDAVKPDIIHIHGSENYFHQIVGRTCVPIVVSIQGNPTVYAHKFKVGFHGDCMRYKNGPLTLKSFLLGRKSFLDDYNELCFMSKVEKTDFKAIKNIIGRTDWDRRITRVLAPDSRYFVVNEALRDSFYENVWNMEAPNEKIIIHTTNGNNYYKGFETLCHALSILNNNGYEVEWRVAGVAKNSPINCITKKYIGQDYPKKGLVLLGSLDEKGLVDSLKTAHIYVMPSHIENSPNNLCEAMLLGMPCITTLAGGSDSILINKKEGIVIQDGDPWSMAGAILELYSDWNKAIQYGINAREHALVRHNRKAIVNSLLNTYSQITGLSE